MLSENTGYTISLPSITREIKRFYFHRCSHLLLPRGAGSDRDYMFPDRSVLQSEEDRGDEQKATDKDSDCRICIDIGNGPQAANPLPTGLQTSGQAGHKTDEEAKAHQKTETSPQLAPKTRQTVPQTKQGLFK